MAGFADDVFRAGLRSATESLTAWGKAVAPEAAIEIREAGGFWRLTARPKTKGACPLTLVLRNDQKFDLGLAGERFEDRDIEDFALFGAIARAVEQGRVEQVRSACAFTGAPRSIETRLIFEDGSVWSSARWLASAPRQAAGEDEVQDTVRFLPYRR